MKNVVKTFVLAIFTLCAVQSISAQEFNKGTNVINAGIGFGGAFDTGGFGSSAAVGVNASYERGIWEVGGPGVISLGGYLGTTAYRLNFGTGNNTVRYTSIGARSAYHFNFIEVQNLDVYGGAMLSFNIVSFNNNSFNGLNSRLSASIFGGARYYFNDQFAAFAEVGYGVSFLSLGASYRF